MSGQLRSAGWVVLLLGACGSGREHVLDRSEPQLQLRQVQSRAFDTTDVDKTLRTVIATLQDLDYVIDKADDAFGTVSGTKLDAYQLRMTVIVRKRGAKQLLVRVNAQLDVTPVRESRPYQEFFAALEKSMSLTARQVD